MRGKRLKVGITLYIRPGAQSIWENGVFQNCYFLAMLMKCVEQVEAVFLVNGGEGSSEPSNPFLEYAPAPVIDLETARETLDVVIELSAQLDPKWTRAFRARGGHVVAMRVANDYVIDIERMIFNLAPGTLASGSPYSAVWTLPAFERTCASYYQASLRAPVKTMPHLWSPVLLERALSRSAKPFGYVPGRDRWRLAVLEPNICMVKTSHLAMLLADVAHRDNPHFIECLRVFNARTLAIDRHFINFAHGLNLVRQGLVSFEARYPIAFVMSQQTDAIVSHHWDNAQNYLYYEALYGGYPLIHNSDMIGQCGYRYADFNCTDGAIMLRHAFAVHDQGLDDYQRSAQAFLRTLDPCAPENVSCYSEGLAALYQD
ncbi:DUF2827 domain-containing protein [Burkholderia ubonensis]|uniref:DUF2827 domain-containing protein n=1 Tax=Burkholderia ubonensis TaxID=101571 RepID=UPI00075F5F8D|nr:DUF2827 domain-containing protein [Burkholderia ubonensis]KVW61209.1 hypothetical protein WK99_15890 [Burkholderia ubonensis]